MRIRSFFTLFLLTLVGTGCVRSIQPILKDDQLVADNAIVGKWAFKDAKETVEIQAAPEEKNYKLTFTDKDGKTGAFLARLGKVGDLTIAEVRPDDPAPAASDTYKMHLLPLYSFLVIRQTTPDLTFTLMSPDWLRKYLGEHPEELHVVNTGGDGYVVSSPTADIQAFVLKHIKDEGMLGELSVLVRQK